MKHPARTKTAKVPTKSGGSYSYNYADLADVLDAVRGPFSENGLSVMQTAFSDGMVVGVVTRIMHLSGQWIEGTLSLPCADTKPQTIGSAITYARRYSLSPMAGIASDDDDDASLAQEVTADISQRQRGQASRPTAQPVEKPSMGERVDKMLKAFASIGIPAEEVQQELGKPLEQCTDDDLKELASKYKDLKAIHDSKDVSDDTPKGSLGDKLTSGFKGSSKKK